MKRSELIFNVASVPVDFFVILAAASLAYFLRYEVETLPVLFDLTYRQYLQLIILAVPFLQLLFALSGLYTQKSTRSFWREIGKISLAVSAGLMIVVVLFFFNQHLFPSRLIILMGWVLTIVLVTLGRGILLLLERSLLSRGIGRHRMIVVEGDTKLPIIEEVGRDSRFGYEIAFRTRYSEQALSDIERIHRQRRIDELLQADPQLVPDHVMKLVGLCSDLGIKFSFVPSILESQRANVEADVIGSIPVIRVKPTPLDGWGKVVKRIMDVVISGFGLVFFSPLFVLIAVAIKFDSPGAVFFHQRRGSSFHNFEFYKFRTMHSKLSEGSPEGDRIRSELEKLNARRGPYVKIKEDPRVTKVGRFLRRTKLDELPQLWHVLRGQMSLVGPRIHMLKEVAKFENRYRKIFSTIKPGATGLTQISQYYNPAEPILPFDEEIKLDLFYIENWSVWLDLSIIFKTAALLLTSREKGNY